MNIILALKWQKLQSTTKPNDFFLFWLNRTLLRKFEVFLHLNSLLTPIVLPMKGNRDSGIREILPVESGILGFGIRNTA